MPANTDAIFPKAADLSNNSGTGMNQPITAAANDYTGISANNSLVFTADATNGGKLVRLRCMAVSTNIATVLRIYINNGSTPTTATNNTLYGNQSLPATTAIATDAVREIDYPMGDDFLLPAGWRIYVGLGTAVAGGWMITPIGYKY